MVQNRALYFEKVPQGLPVEGQDLVIKDESIDLDNVSPPKGGLVLKKNYLSLDPYLRGRMREAGTKSYLPAFELGKPIMNFSISTVLKSDNPSFKVGQIVSHMGAFKEYEILEENYLGPKAFNVKVIESSEGIDPKLFLSPLGMPGITAYSSLYEIGKPKKGETIFVSSASGAVGALVGQLAKLEGLTVIGSVGDEQKLEYITKELGFDAGFIYKKEKPRDALARLAPNGIDIYYDNVGAEHLEAALEKMNFHGRVVVCGAISGYNSTDPEAAYGIKTMSKVLIQRLTIRGFIQSDPDMGPMWTEEHQRNVRKYIKDGSVKSSIHTTKGFENAVTAFLELFSGKNFGKAILEVSPVEGSSA